ncbi:MAG TPA: glycosyltransferase [Feifaniaceae bacterium]|nr:glycosyltransferase [Feifaniaceae bacterium]
MKKLLIVTHKMSGGGCERVIAQLLSCYAQEGVECLLATECGVPSFYDLPEQVRHIYLSFDKTLRPSSIPRAYQKLRKLVLQEKPDVVLAMPEKVNVWTVLFLLGTGVPVVVSERNDPHRHPESKIKRLLRWLFYPFAKGFIFQTEDAAAFFPKKIRSRGVVLDNPLDIARIPARFEGARRPVVAAAGRFHQQKNFAMLIRAFARFYKTHHSYSLVIYGEGGEKQALMRLASSLGVAGSVEFAGQSKTLLSEINDCAMFVLSSDYEGMPNVLIEAMACGLCCVATDCPIGGVRSLVKDGENGLLIGVGDEDALSFAMSAIADDPMLAERLGNNAAQIQSRLDEAVVAGQWMRYLEQVAAK